jgi:hypothetical protein
MNCRVLAPALPQKSRAVIDRRYSLRCATVGALYERPALTVIFYCEDGGLVYAHDCSAWQAGGGRPVDRPHGGGELNQSSVHGCGCEIHARHDSSSRSGVGYDGSRGAALDRSHGLQPWLRSAAAPRLNRDHSEFLHFGISEVTGLYYKNRFRKADFLCFLCLLCSVPYHEALCARASSGCIRYFRSSRTNFAWISSGARFFMNSATTLSSCSFESQRSAKSQTMASSRSQ